MSTQPCIYEPAQFTRYDGQTVEDSRWRLVALFHLVCGPFGFAGWYYGQSVACVLVSFVGGVVLIGAVFGGLWPRLNLAVQGGFVYYGLTPGKVTDVSFDRDALAGHAFVLRRNVPGTGYSVTVDSIRDEYAVEHQPTESSWVRLVVRADGAWCAMDERQTVTILPKPDPSVDADQLFDLIGQALASAPDVRRYREKQ